MGGDGGGGPAVVFSITCTVVHDIYLAYYSASRI